MKQDNYRTSNIQKATATKANSQRASLVTETKSSIKSTVRTSVLPQNSANNNRTRPLTTRSSQIYHNSNNPKIQITSSLSVQRNNKKSTNGFGSTFTMKEFSSNKNILLNDVINRPLSAPIRSQVRSQRRTVVPQSSTHSSIEQIRPSLSSTTNGQATFPRSTSSTLNQGRKSGIPTIGNQQKSSTTTVTR